MGSALKSWETKALQNNGNVFSVGNITASNSSRISPSLPPRPQDFNYNSHSSGFGPSYGYGNGSGHNSYIGYGNNYPYRHSIYNSYAGNNSGYESYGGYRGSLMYGGVGSSSGRDDAETRFIQFAEERSRHTFENVENIVHIVNNVASMLDNTLFAMTSSFRAILSVAENVRRLSSTFSQILHAVNVFRLMRWFYRTFLRLAGFTIPQQFNSKAWNEAAGALGAFSTTADHTTSGMVSTWPTLAFLAALVSIPYIITKILPHYEDKLDPKKWRSSGIRAKVAFDFIASSPNELNIRTNDEILLAPKHIQEEMRLTNCGWAYATTSIGDKCGVVPLNYIIITKKSGSTVREDSLPVPQLPTQYKPQKRVRFGENQFYDNDIPLKTNESKGDLS